MTSQAQMVCTHAIFISPWNTPEKVQFYLYLSKMNEIAIYRNNTHLFPQQNISLLSSSSNIKVVTLTKVFGICRLISSLYKIDWVLSEESTKNSLLNLMHLLLMAYISI